MNIPALVTLLCPFFPSACEPTADEPVEAARIVIADEPRRVRMGETMGSTSGDSTTGEDGTTTGGEMGTTSTGDGSSTTDDLPIADTEGCPWWGCDGLPGGGEGCLYWECEPGEKWRWFNVLTDCSFPKGHPEMGDAACPSPKKCLTTDDFGPYWTFPNFEAYLDEIPYQPGLCALPAPYYNQEDPCWELDIALSEDPNTGYGGVMQVFPVNLPGESFCAFTSGYEGLYAGLIGFSFYSGVPDTVWLYTGCDMMGECELGP